LPRRIVWHQKRGIIRNTLLNIELQHLYAAKSGSGVVNRQRVGIGDRDHGKLLP
jgi:hypothetical protein